MPDEFIKNDTPNVSGPESGALFLFCIPFCINCSKQRQLSKHPQNSSTCQCSCFLSGSICSELWLSVIPPNELIRNQLSTKSQPTLRWAWTWHTVDPRVYSCSLHLINRAFLFTPHGAKECPILNRVTGNFTQKIKFPYLSDPELAFNVKRCVAANLQDQMVKCY